MGWATIGAIAVFLAVGATATVHAAPPLSPGTYRCSAYNISGIGGSCRNTPPLALNRDGTYRFSSTRGHWNTKGGKLHLSGSRLWGAGKILGADTVRFAYDYRGWHHVVTWVRRGNAATDTGSGGSPSKRYVGVSLTLKFDRSVGGVDGFVIVPAASARSYTRNAPLPKGAVEGLAWETGATAVSLATSRSNQLLSGRRYVVFLCWPAETIPVAVLDLPSQERDYTATLEATLNRAAVLRRLGARETAEHPPPAEPDTPPSPAPHSSVHSRPHSALSPAPANAGGSPSAGAPASPPRKCNPLIPQYSQPGCVE